MDKETDYGVWLKLDKCFFNLPLDVYVCGLYLQPEGSTYAKSDIFEKIENDLNYFSSIGETILIGDMNARVGGADDYISGSNAFDVIDNMYCDDFTPSKRFDQDTITNNYGKQLINLCKNSGMLLLNGRTIGDVTGSCTIFNKQVVQ